MTVRLRPLGPGDLDRVDELEPQLFGRAAWSRAAYVEELRAPGRRYVAAEAPDGALVGYAGIALARECEVMTVGVDRAWQRQGIGAALVDALLDAAREASARRVYLEVRASDEGAQRLYRRAGFRPVGRRRGYYQPEGEDAVVMRLDLDHPGAPAPADEGAPAAGRREENR